MIFEPSAISGMSSSISIESIEAAVRPHLKLLGADAPLSPTQPLGEVGLDSMAAIRSGAPASASKLSASWARSRSQIPVINSSFDLK